MKAFISYMDDNDEIISGTFELIEEKDNYIAIRSGKNEIILPFHRIRKIKKQLKGGNKY